MSVLNYILFNWEDLRKIENIKKKSKFWTNNITLLVWWQRRTDRVMGAGYVWLIGDDSTALAAWWVLVMSG